MTAADPLLGATLQRWNVTEKIGHGAMGDVYLGVQPEIGARVAIKVLPERYARNARKLERFFAEARLVNRVRHEKIVNVIDLATTPSGRPYIVMEHLEGEPLSSHRLAPAALVAFTREVLDALGAAHAVGVVHRDVKPANLFVTPRGHAKVLDFGIAKLAVADSSDPDAHAEDDVLTRTGVVLGTPRYMAPEQVRADAIDGRADLYALGVVLYEQLAGRPPFDAETTYALMAMHVEAPLPPAPEIPPRLFAVIARAMEKRPADRFPDAAAMSAALADAISERAGAPSASPRVPRASRVRPFAIVVAIVVAGVGLGLVVPKRASSSHALATADLLSSGPASTSAAPVAASASVPPATSPPVEPFDPMVHIAEATSAVQAVSSTARLVTMRAMVDAHGLVDVEHGTAVSYSFQEPVSDGTTGRWVYVVSAAGRSLLRQTGLPEYVVEEPPKCTMAYALARAHKAGLGASSELTVLYDDGYWSLYWPSYHMYSGYLSFDDDCALPDAGAPAAHDAAR